MNKDPEIEVDAEMIDRPGDNMEPVKPSVGDTHDGGHGDCGGKPKKIRIIVKRPGGFVGPIVKEPAS
jgi:hypothetical protein